MKKKFLLTALSVCSVLLLFADYAPRDSFMINQPDGTFLWVYECGDEDFNWEESTDGYVIIQNAKGVMEYATIIDNQVKASGIKVNNVQDKSPGEKTFAKNQTRLVHSVMNREAKETIQKLSSNLRITLPTSPVVGVRKILTVLVGFSDYPFTYNQTNFDSLMNLVNYSGHGNAGSVRDFYYKNSYGQLALQSTVIGPFVAAHNAIYYQRPKGGNPNSKAYELVREAIEYAKSVNIDYSTLDGNNDGKIDGVHIVYAGNRYHVGDPGIIWPYHSTFDTTFIQNGHNITISDYIMTPECSGYTDTEITSIGTICHELGHVLGAPDFYPRGVGPSGDIHLGTDLWDVMATGDQVYFGGTYPTHHNPYTKTAIFQWTNPVTIDSTETNTTYNIPASSTNANAIYKIPTKTEGEYYLLENRQKVSFDRYLPDSGLLIYHIHKDIESAIATNTVNSSLPQMCYLVDPKSVTAIPSGTDTTSYGTPALNIFPANYIDGTTNIFFTSQTTPRSQSWAGEPTGVDVCFIQHDGNNMKFVVNPIIEGPDRLSDTTYFSVSNVPDGATCTWTVTPPHYTIGEFTIHNNGTPSICVTRDPQPTPMFNGLNTEQERIIIIPPVPDIGSVDVIISDGNDHSYHISKTLYSGVWFHSNALSKEKKFPYTLELWHSTSGLLRTQNIRSADEQIDTTGLPQGLYIIITKENGQPIKQTKIMIQ